MAVTYTPDVVTQGDGFCVVRVSFVRDGAPVKLGTYSYAETTVGTGDPAAAVEHVERHVLPDLRRYYRAALVDLELPYQEPVPEPTVPLEPDPPVGE